MKRRIIPVLAAVLIIFAGALAVTLRLDHKAAPRTQIASSTRLAPCPAAASTSPSPVGDKVGSWPFHLVMKGTFAMLADNTSSSLLALQACGSEESSLRVVELQPSTGAATASRRFPGAAPIASSVAASSTDIWLGESRLDLKGPTDEAPYRLFLVELSKQHLKVVKSLSAGRGYGLDLLSGPGGRVVVCTGERLYEVTPSGGLHPIASFPGVVAQHMALVPGTDEVVLSLFTPSASAPAASTKLAVVDLATGDLVSSVALPAGDEVGSLASVRGAALAAVAASGSTQVERFDLTSRRHQLTTAPSPQARSLSSISLAATAQSLFYFGPSTLACADPASGAARASTQPSGQTQSLSALSHVGNTTFVVAPAGIGRLRPPSSCRQ